MSNLTKFREELKLSKLELARRATISPADLTKLENGQVFPWPGWRKRLAKALETTEEALFPEVVNGGK